MNNEIPKIIWQTHEPKYADLLNFQKNVINTWINLNPEWTHIYADAEQRAKDVESFDKKLYLSYLRETKVTQADMWRYIMVYQNGGVYADMDSVCVKPIDYFLDKNYSSQDVICTNIYDYLDRSNNKTIAVNNSNFAAIKNSKAIKDVLSDVSFAYRMLLEEYIPGPTVPIKYMCWDSFHRNVIRNKDIALFDFNCGLHDQTYKEKFNDFTVDFYGEKILYSELCNTKNWNIF